MHPSPHSKRASAATALALISALAACDPGPLDWREPRELSSAPPPDSRLVIEDFSLARFETLRASAAAPPSTACPGSVVSARMSEGYWHRAWWEAPPEGPATLLTSRSTDGGETWSAPVVIDTSDRWPTGCQRLPPSIAADSITRFVHVVFYMRAPNGDGVWYAHSMDEGATWHSQYGLIYGEDPARADVAADGELVAVAYEHPNAAERRVGLALSRDGGHTFLPRLVVSPRSGAASAPRAAARRPGVGIAWQEGEGRWMARVGVVR